MDQISPSRRLFLKRTALATAGVVLLSGDAFASVLNNPNAPSSYNPYSDRTTDLRKSGSTESPVTVQGVIYNKQTQLPIVNAKIEVWHVSPNSKNVNHRAHFFTDDLGRYNFITDFPGREVRKKPRIQFKITKDDFFRFNTLIFDTKMAYVDQDQWKEVNALGDLFHPKLQYKLDSYNIQFNQVL